MFNKAEIMKEAWKRVKMANREKYSLSFLLARALRGAWADAKHEAAMVARRAIPSCPIRQQIAMLDNKDRWTSEDYKRSDELYANKMRSK